MQEHQPLSELLPAPIEKNKDDGGTLGPTGTLSGNCSGRAALRREQQEQLQSNHCEK
jgi:hypothetical protein